MTYILESRGVSKRIMTRDEVETFCYSRCIMKPTTFKYFVAVEDYKIIGTDTVVNKGDFIVMFPDRVIAYTPSEFSKYMDIIHPAYPTLKDDVYEVPQTC